jgi:DNA-binding MarR family transcriptional regulator
LEREPAPPLIGALLRVPYEEVRRRMLDHLHRNGFGDLSAAHMNVLLYPGPQGRRPSEITGDSRMSKQAVHHLLNEVERLGYIERQPDPDDARSKRIVLTRRGESLRVAIRQAVADVEGDWERQLGTRRFALLKGLLQELNASFRR